MDRDGTDSDGFTSREALSDFLQGVEEKLSADFGVISSWSECQKAKREIAETMGVLEGYDTWNPTAFLKVSARYRELVEQGEIQEDPDFADGKLFEEVDNYLRGEGDTIYDDVDNSV